MYNIEESIERQLRIINASKPTFIFPEALDPRIIEAGLRLIDYINVVFMASKNEVKNIVKENLPEFYENIDSYLSFVKCIDIDKEDIKEEFAHELCEISKGKKWKLDIEQSRDFLNNKIFYSIMAVRLGYANAVLGGVVSTSRDFFSPCLRLLEKDDTVFETAIFCLPDNYPEGVFSSNIAVFADVAVNTEMTQEKLTSIAIGSCQIARDLITEDVLPKINGAILSYSTKGSGAGETVDMIRKADKNIQEKLEELKNTDPRYESIYIDSELQVSVALSEKAAKNKLKDKYSEKSAAGRANVLLAPNLDMGNFFYHFFATNYPDAKKILLVGGLKNQATDFSRSSTADDIILTAKALSLRIVKSKDYIGTKHYYFFKKIRTLVINPGSTSTKIAVYDGNREIFTENIYHPVEELSKYNSIVDQKDFRKEIIMNKLKENNIDISEINGVIGRGGLLRPIEGGTYIINKNILNDLQTCKYGEHASNLGALIAHEVAKELKLDAYIADPVVVDEMMPVSRITGLKDMPRLSIWHALNQKACAKRYARQLGKKYENINLIVVHLGGGISIGAHKFGKVVDVNNALNGEGPLTPERSGTLPVAQLIDLCFSGEYTNNQIKLMNKGKGGLISHLGTSSLIEVEQRMNEGDEYAKLVFDALIYQLAKYTTYVLPVFSDTHLDAIILTGGMAKSNLLVEEYKNYLKMLEIPLIVYEGENEMEALRDSLINVLMKNEKAKVY